MKRNAAKHTDACRCDSPCDVHNGVCGACLMPLADTSRAEGGQLIENVARPNTPQKVVIIVRGGVVQDVIGSEGVLVDVLNYDSAKNNADELDRCESVFQETKKALHANILKQLF